MAIKKKDIQEVVKKVKNGPLTEKELTAISVIEKFIDRKILEQVNKGKEIIYIELGYVNFNYRLADLVITDDMRIKKMRDEIDRRYKKSGWKIRVELDDGLDGPNMSGPDYWVLY